MKETKNVFMSELTEVFSKRQQQFVQFAYSYVRNREEAEDIVMGAFTNVWEHRNELQEDTNISALLLTAIKNRSLNHLQHLEVRCLLYTSDAADDLTRVDLGGRRIIKKKIF